MVSTLVFLSMLDFHASSFYFLYHFHHKLYVPWIFSGSWEIASLRSWSACFRNSVFLGFRSQYFTMAIRWLENLSFNAVITFSSSITLPNSWRIYIEVKLFITKKKYYHKHLWRVKLMYCKCVNSDNTAHSFYWA